MGFKELFMKNLYIAIRNSSSTDNSFDIKSYKYEFELSGS